MFSRLFVVLGILKVAPPAYLKLGCLSLADRLSLLLALRCAVQDEQCGTSSCASWLLRVGVGRDGRPEEHKACREAMGSMHVNPVSYGLEAERLA